MSKADYFLGIDTGTQSVRVVIADVNGNIIAENEQVYKTYFPKPGWAEQKPDEWWSSFSTALENTTKSVADGILKNIRAVSVCSTSSTVVPVDENCNALMDAILWMDTRSTKEMELINATKHWVLDYCGKEVSAEWGVPKALWIKNNLKDVYSKTYKIIEFLDWMNYRLCGRFSTSICQTACKWNFVKAEGGYDDEFFNKIGMEDYKEKFVTEVTGVGEVIGTIDRGLADKYGLNPEMLVVQGGIDAHIGMLGLGVAKPGKIAQIMGTSFVQLGFAESKPNVDGVWGPYCDPVVPGAWLLEAGQVSAGSISKWFLQEFELDKMENPFAFLDEKLKDIPIGAEGLVALDFFQGNRTPYRDPYARGVIYGLTLSHTKFHIYKALLESVAYGTKNIIDNFEKQGYPVDVIVGCGGVTKDKTWMQIISDAIGKPIIVTKNPNAGALGCAITAAVGARAYPDFDAATKGMVEEDYSVHPNLEVYKEYQKVFDLYVEIYDKLKGTMASQA